MSRSAAALLAVSLAAPSLFAQQKPPEPPPAFGETVEVRVINVDVVVTDKNGNRVRGLTKEDFELFENGQKKEITNFSAIDERESAAQLAALPDQSAPTVAAVPPEQRRHIVVFVDNTSIIPGNRNRIVPELRNFLKASMRPGDDVTIDTWNPGLKVELNRTTDRTTALAILDQVAKTATTGSNLVVQKQQVQRELRDMTRDFASDGINNPNEDKFAPPEAPGQTKNGPAKFSPASQGEKPPYERALSPVRTFAELVLHDLKSKGDAMRGVLGEMSGLEGKKVFVFLTESFSVAPAREMFEYLDTIKDRFKNGDYQNPRMSITKYNEDEVFRAVIGAANASGVTLYPISATGMSGDLRTADASTEVGWGDKPGLVSVGKSSEQPLREIADATGGIALTGSNNYKLAFDRILGDLTEYYSIGYRASASSKDAVRKLDVKVSKPGLVVRKRESFLQRTPETEVREALKTNVVAPAAPAVVVSAPAAVAATPAAQLPVVKNDLGIIVNKGDVQNDGETLTVPLEIRIPLEALTLLPDGKDLTGKFSVHTTFLLHDGTLSEGSTRQQNVRFPADQMEPGKKVTLRLNMSIDPGTETVAVAVVDEIAKKTGYGSVKLQ